MMEWKLRDINKCAGRTEQEKREEILLFETQEVHLFQITCMLKRHVKKVCHVSFIPKRMQL